MEWLAYSAKGAVIARIIPAVRETESEKIAKPCEIQVMRLSRDQSHFDQIARFPTFNGRTPLKLLVSDWADRIVTLDEEGAMGRSDRAVVVYDGMGKVLGSWKLTELLTDRERALVHSSVSSTWWRDRELLVLRQFEIQGPVTFPDPRMPERPVRYTLLLNLDKMSWENFLEK